MYKIYDDGQEYGPIEEQELRSWIREGRVLGTTLAFKEGLEDWVPLSDFIEFATDFATVEFAAASPKSQLLKAVAPKTPGKTAKAETAPVVTAAGAPKKGSRALVISVVVLALCIGLAAGWFLPGLLMKEASVSSPIVPMAKKTKKSDAPAKVSAEKSSYAEVAKHLDTHGQLFMYLSTEQLGAQADQLFEGFSKIAEKARPPSGTGPATGPDANTGLKLLRQAYRESGLMDVSGVGLSSFAVEKGLYRNRLAAHHYPDKSDGKLWKLFGANPHELAAIKLLPASTAFAYHTDLDAKLAWGWIKTLVEQSGDKALIEMFNQISANPQTGPMIEGLLASVSEVGIAITLNDSKKIPFPVGDKVMEFPEPGLIVLLKAKDDKVAQSMEPFLALGPIKPQKIAVGTNELTTMMPLPLPVPLQVTMFKADGYVVVCSTLALAKEIVAIKSGETPGLVASEEFQKLSKGTAQDGNQFQFVSARMGQTLQQLQQSAAKDAPPEINEVMSFFNDPKAPPFSHFGVLKVTSEGIQLDSLATTSGPQSLALQAGVLPAAIAAGFILPAVSKARGSTEGTECQTNLKQAGVAVLIYQDDNQKMPTSWKDVSAELSSPTALVCPDDKQRQSAANWAAFTPLNATYQLLPVTGKLTPASIVARCPIHNHTLHADGSVKTSAKTAPVPPLTPPPLPLPADSQPPKKAL